MVFIREKQFLYAYYILQPPKIQQRQDKSLWIFLNKKHKNILHTVLEGIGVLFSL